MRSWLPASGSWVTTQSTMYCVNSDGIPGHPPLGFFCFQRFQKRAPCNGLHLDRRESAPPSTAFLLFPEECNVQPTPVEAPSSCCFSVVFPNDKVGSVRFTKLPSPDLSLCNRISRGALLYAESVFHSLRPLWALDLCLVNDNPNVWR